MASHTSFLPAGYRLRHPQRRDAEAVTAIKQAVDIARHGDSDVTADDVLEEWALPRLNSEKDLWVIDDETGTTVAYGLCWTENPPHEVVADQCVDPGHRGLGLSELLLDLGEARAAEFARGVSDGRPVQLGVFTHESDAERLALFARHGYRKTRVFYRLYRELAGPVEAAAWPAGIAIRHFRPECDAAAVHAAGEEAFRDHFRPTTMDLDEWLECLSARSDFDPGLLFVAWDGDQVAGSVLATQTPGGGYVDELSVRRPWRGRGLGRALLLHEFAELRRRGLPCAYLGVDGANPTGAMHLYASVGLEPRRGATWFLEKDVPAS
jgi:mycothiol synthase